MPESLNFNSSGSYIANNNPSNKPMQIIDYFAKHNINQFFNISESQEQAEVTPSEFTTPHLKFLYFSNNAEDINLVYNLSLLKKLMLTKQPDKSKYTEQFTKAFRIMNNSDTKILRSLARACKFNTTVREIEENSIEAEKHILFDQNSSGSSDSLNISLNKNKFNISIGDCSFNIDTNGNIDFPVSENSPIE